MAEQGKSNKSKFNRQRRTSISRKLAKAKISIPNVPVKLSQWERFMKYSKVVYSVLGGISLLLGLYFYKDPILSLFSSEQELYEKKNFIKGILIPQSNTDPNGQVTIMYGTNAEGYQLSKLREGIEISPLVSS